MRNYLVRWSTHVNAPNPVDAVKQALGIMQDPYSTAVVFRVRDSDGYSEVIDYEAVQLKQVCSICGAVPVNEQGHCAAHADCLPDYEEEYDLDER